MYVTSPRSLEKACDELLKDLQDLPVAQPVTPPPPPPVTPPKNNPGKPVTQALRALRTIVQARPVPPGDPRVRPRKSAISKGKAPRAAGPAPLLARSSSESATVAHVAAVVHHAVQREAQKWESEISKAKQEVLLLQKTLDQKTEELEELREINRATARRVREAEGRTGSIARNYARYTKTVQNVVGAVDANLVRQADASRQELKDLRKSLENCIKLVDSRVTQHITQHIKASRDAFAALRTSLIEGGAADSAATKKRPSP